MPSQSSAKLKYVLAALIVVWIGLGGGLYVYWRAADMKPYAQSRIPGDWSVVGLDGQTRGTITLSPDGKFDDGEYVGHWSIQDGDVHVKCWEGKPRLSKAYLFRHVDELVLAPQYDPQSGALTLQGEHATLTRK